MAIKMSSKSIMQRVDRKFVIILRKKYPNVNMPEATRNLTTILEEMLYGKNNKE